MTGRDRVIAGLQSTTPDRTPRDMWTLPAVCLFDQDVLDAVQAEYPMDMTWCPLSETEGDAALECVRRPGKYTDDWGCVWHVGEPGVVGEAKEPVLNDWSRLAGFQPPWHLVENRNLGYANRCCDRADSFMLSGLTAQPFERMQFLRGTENLFIDIAYGTANFRRLLEMVHEYFVLEIEIWCKSRVDGVFL